MVSSMSETATHADRDQRGRFLTGTKPGPGRVKGSRNLLSESFLGDLNDAWQRFGVAALEKCAQEQPGVLIKVIASLLPKDVRIDLTVDATEFASRYNQALVLLGNSPEPPRPRKPLPGQPRLIENGDGR
jgi:hypothetical protein